MLGMGGNNMKLYDKQNKKKAKLCDFSHKAEPMLKIIKQFPS